MSSYIAGPLSCSRWAPVNSPWSAVKNTAVSSASPSSSRRVQDPADLLVDQGDVAPVDRDQLAGRSPSAWCRRSSARCSSAAPAACRRRSPRSTRGSSTVSGSYQVEVGVGHEVRQVRAEEVSARKNGRCRSAAYRSSMLDGAGGEVVLEGRLHRLVQPGGQQVARAAVGQRAPDPVTDRVRRQAAARPSRPGNRGGRPGCASRADAAPSKP